MSASKPSTLPLLAAVAVVVLAATLGPSFLPDNAVSMSGSATIDGLTFPSTIKIAGTKQMLVGGGTRHKWSFKVYSLGIFGDKKLVKSLKKKYPDGGAGVTRDFSESKQARTLLLRFQREVASKDVSEALGEALVDKVGKETSGQISAIHLWICKHGKAGFVKGSDLFITCKGEKLWASLTEGKDASTTSNKGLCSAVFQVYLGATPVSPQAKEGFVKGFADLTLD
ncbi:LOW QUALITY PROTEIN: hypothetical protein ACHAXT_009863 [Thalassiosira profunda]